MKTILYKNYFLVNIFNLKNIFMLNILYILLKIMVEKRDDKESDCKLDMIIIKDKVIEEEEVVVVVR